MFFTFVNMAIVIHYVTIIVPVLTAISGIVAFNADNNRTICEENFLRQMRGIVWPPFTVFQFAVGLAVPAQVPNRTIFTNWGILNNVPLPAKVEQLYLKLPETRKHMRKYTHQNLYQFLENVFGKWNGDVLKSSTRTKSQNIKAPTSQCVLRSICLATSLENNGKKELIYQIMKLLFLYVHSQIKYI